jgi:hypothetical protein
MPRKIYRDQTAKPPAPPKPDKTPTGVRIAQWLFIAAALGAIGWMIHTLPKERALVCNGGFTGGPTSFGSCHYE